MIIDYVTKELSDWEIPNFQCLDKLGRMKFFSSCLGFPEFMVNPGNFPKTGKFEKLGLKQKQDG